MRPQVSSQDLINLLSRYRIPVDVEASTQKAISDIMSGKEIQFTKEHSLNRANRPDFFVDGVVIEVKIKGSAREIYSQLERYSKFDEVKEILLVTNKAMGLPSLISGKPCRVLNLGRSWL